MKIPENVYQSIILFDGVCNLCNGFVQFLIKRDLKSKFKFATLQSESGQRLLGKCNLTKDKTETVILIDGGEKYIKSEAVFRIIRILGGWIKLVLIFSLLPRAFTDFIYDQVAKNRYRIFGKRNECMVPTPALRNRFL